MSKIRYIDCPYIFRAPKWIYNGPNMLEFIVTRKKWQPDGMFTLLTKTDYYAFIEDTPIELLSRYVIAIEIYEQNNTVTTTADIDVARALTKTAIYVKTIDGAEYILPLSLYANKENLELTFQYLLTHFRIF